MLLEILTCLKALILIILPRQFQINKFTYFCRPLMLDFLMPESDKDRGENPIVDSLAVASDWTIVSKCALHGLIYVFDLKASITLYQDKICNS